MDINKNQQVNTFLKGMNTDLSDSLLDSSQYRYAENLRLVTNTDSNSGELRLVDGTITIGNAFDGEIIYLNSIREYVVVITRKIVEGIGQWSICVSDDKGAHFTTIFGPCTEELLWNTQETTNNGLTSVTHLDAAICGVLRWESDNNIKFYFVDNTGNHGIMSIQIAKNEWDVQNFQAPKKFITISGYQDILLKSPQVAISSQSGLLKPAKVQYSYRLFKTGGAVTTLAPLSKTLQLLKDDGKGYSYSEVTNKSVKITIDSLPITNLDSIQIFRINYMQNGQAPTIHKICEKRIDGQSSFVFIDRGQNLEQLGVSEFLSYNSFYIKPKIIESKGDTLFAANLTYAQDDADKDFEDWDATSLSTGNYTYGGELCHHQFTDNPSYTYNTDWWRPEEGSDKIGGVGTNIDWELVQEPVIINDNGTVTGASNTYKHDETYRFGIILYNDKGKATSVKWIADIRIPPCPAAEISNGVYEMRRCTIKFNVKHLPTGCTGYQIVQCPRTISDRHVLMQGIVARPYRFQECKNNHFNFTNYLCPTGLMTMQDMVADNITTSNNVVHMDYSGQTGQTQVLDSLGNWHPWEARLENNYGLTYKFTNDRITKAGVSVTDTVDQSDTNGSAYRGTIASSVQDVVQFASPEYAYQSDDIKNILDTYKNQIKLEHAFVYTTKGDTVIRRVQQDQDSQNGITSYIESSNTPSPLTRLSYTSSAKEGNNNIYPFRYRNGIHHTDSDESGTHNYTFLQSDIDVVTDVAVYANGDNTIGVNRLRDGSWLKKNIIIQGDTNVFPEYLSFNYIKPYSINTQSEIVPTYPSISSVAYPDVPEWNKFTNGDTIRFADDVTAIGTYSFVNWSAPLIMTGLDFSKNGELALATDSDGSTGTHPVSLNSGDFSNHIKAQSKFFQPLGTGGKYILFKLDNSLKFGNTRLPHIFGEIETQLCLNDIIDGQEVPFTPIHIANLVKDVVPYGGYSKYAIDSSTYVGGGYFGTTTGEIVVDGGDAYIGLFKYNASHIWKDGTYTTGTTKMATVYSVPLESDIDLRTAYGHQYGSSGNNSYYIQDKPASFDGYTQEKESYMYNTAYNQTPNVMTYSTAVYNEVSNFNWDTRIHNSELKTNGETIDSWLTFKAMNFLDVDSRFGEITYMKLFKDRLLYWQDKAFGVVSSNERTALTDTNNNQIILGNGGILQRFDYISTVYGMKPNQFVSTQSNHNLYFWDGHEKEILAYGETLIPLTTVKGLRNYINQHDEVDRPCMFYDNKNKEVVSSVVEDGSIVYSEQIEAFTSIYTYTPLFHTDVFENMISATTNQLYLHNVKRDNVKLFGVDAKPLLQYVVNTEATMPKVFDIQTFGGRFYGGDDISDLQFKYNTPLKQESSCTGTSVTNREYDFRLDIPRNKVLRNGQITSLDVTKEWGNRLRGKTMRCELKSTSNSSDFSLQYIITKYRMSWS